MSTAGIVRAGGFGTRFVDGEKTLAELDGRPLISHAVDALRPIVDTIVVSCREEQIEAFQRVLEGVTYRPDPTPDEGPLAGLAAALGGLDAEQVAVTTADRPCVPPGLYRDFFERLQRDGVVIQSAGIKQPSPAVFDTAALRKSVQRRRASGEKRLRSALMELDLDTVRADRVRERWGEQVLADVNTRDDLAALDE